MPEDPGPHPDIRTSIVIVRDKLARTFDDKRKTLFQNMKDMLEYLDEKTSDKRFYFGTDNFDHVWERLIDRAFGEQDKDKYFPRSRWLLDYGTYKEKHPLMPDTIMIYNGKYYVLDAKCYRYGVTNIPDHLPNGSSINKQITYGEYLEQHLKIPAGSIFNCLHYAFQYGKKLFPYYAASRSHRRGRGWLERQQQTIREDPGHCYGYKVPYVPLSWEADERPSCISRLHSCRAK